MNMLLRRVGVHIRRDAARGLSNGRVLYDALFTRIGYQDYPRADGSVSIEYRPPNEVFRPDSLASLANLPGVVLHPASNFGTKFDGRYPVKGCTGDSVVEHTDHIHTAGTLCVWDDDWNADIASGDIAQLSCGYTLDAGPGGTGPDGRRYDLMHTNIVGDHMAGVPLGRAGSARVVLDGVPRVTRDALALIAAARMDARPYYHDLGINRWPELTQRHQDTMKRITFKMFGRDTALEVAENATPEQVAAAISTAHEAAAQEHVPKADHEKAVADAVKKARDEMAPPFGKKPGAGMEEEEDKKKQDAARQAEIDKIRTDADARATVLATALSVIGPRFDASGKSNDQIKIDVVEAVATKMNRDGAAARKELQDEPEATRSGAVSYAYKRALADLATLPQHHEQLVDTIRQRFEQDRTGDKSPPKPAGPISQGRNDAAAEAALPRHERATARKAS